MTFCRDHWRALRYLPFMHCFKEWQIICEALRDGKQSVILRKGGIHEGKDGFSFGNIPEFVLFPTRFHAQGSLVNLDGEFTPGKEWEVDDEVIFDTLCRVEATYELTDWEQVASLQHLHLWSEDCIKDRFDWEGKGMASGKIHLALIRAYRLPTPLSVSYSKRLGGCRSWVTLDELTAEVDTLTPVISDETFNAIQSELSTLG